jgi:hypothetical protein
MISAGYITHKCPKCSANRYANGTTWRWGEDHLWVKKWVGTKLVNNTIMRDWVGKCIGCHNVAIERCLVLGILLSKLGVKI